MAQVIQASGEPDCTLAKIVYLADPNDYYNARLIAGACAAFQGFSDYSLQNVDVIRQALQQKQSSRCCFVLEILICRQIPVEPFLDLVGKIAFSTRKGERELATKYLKQDVAQAVPWIQAKAINGKTTERDRAIHLLWSVQGEAAQEFLAERQTQETDEKVQQSLQALLSTLATMQTTFKALELPPVLPLQLESPLPETVKSVVQPVFDALQSENLAIHTATVIRHLETGTAQECAKYLNSQNKEKARNLFWPLLQTLMQSPDLNLLHGFRLLILLGYFDIRFRRQYFERRFFTLLNLYHHAHLNQGLRELAVVLQTLGLDPDQLGRLIFEYHPYFADEGIWWEAQATWPYFYERPHLLADVLNDGPNASDYFVRRQNAFRILNLFPQPPASLIPLLWTLALGTAKTDRPFAQRYLNNSPNVTERLLESIQHPDVSTRIIAAEWLANRNDTVAIAPLKDLLRKEKSDATKVAFMRSLERLGAPIDEFLNRDQLLTDAQKGLNKGIPEALSWFPFADLPLVHWTDNHQAVDPTVLTWLIVQGYKQKSPEPNPLLQRYAQLWNEGDRLDLGNFILHQWIAHDTAPSYTQDRAEVLARKNAQNFGQYYPNKTPEQLYREFLNDLLRQCNGSAIKEKGILAIAAACITGASAVPAVKKYLDTWYGNRAAQCNALLQTLSWIEDNASIQYLLSVANRFRTKSIQKEADKLIHAIAERHQWTPEELGDRTIPTAGFG
ncbi:MAG: HEAT repeat domain-containing protein, partial [Thermosynechococcaceae cyanobacterium]